MNLLHDVVCVELLELSLRSLGSFFVVLEREELPFAAKCLHQGISQTAGASALNKKQVPLSTTRMPGLTPRLAITKAMSIEYKI